MTEEPRLVAGRYRLVERIGSGAMGVVWRAHDERLHRTVAVKQLLLAPTLDATETDEAIQRAMREGRIAARLHHPNAIAVFDVVEEDGVPCLVMEYLASRSLAAVMTQNGPLAPQEVARIGAQVAAALAAAHAAGIVHRDIKPGNILLADDGTVKITDFGISRATDDVQVTKTGMIAGTPAYLAPEVACGREPGPAADVFSLGSMLYAAVEGEPPFGLNENTLAVLHAVAAGRINPPRQAGPLTDVLRYLLRTNPEDRPTTAEARMLLQAVADGRQPALPAGALTPTVDPRTLAEGATQVVGQGVPMPTRQVGPAMTGPPPEAPPARRSRGPLVLSSLAVAAVALIGGLLVATGVFNRPPASQPQHVNDTSTTSVVVTPGAMEPTYSTVEETTRRGTRTSTYTRSVTATTQESATAAPTTTSEAPTTTTTTTTVEPTKPPTPSSPKPTPTSAAPTS